MLERKSKSLPREKYCDIRKLSEWHKKQYYRSRALLLGTCASFALNCTQYNKVN